MLFVSYTYGSGILKEQKNGKNKENFAIRSDQSFFLLVNTSLCPFEDERNDETFFFQWEKSKLICIGVNPNSILALLKY